MPDTSIHHLAEQLYEKISNEGLLKQNDAVEIIKEKSGLSYLKTTKTGKLSIARKLRRKLQSLAGNSITWNPGHRGWVYTGKKVSTDTPEGDHIESDLDSGSNTNTAIITKREGKKSSSSRVGEKADTKAKVDKNRKTKSEQTTGSVTQHPENIRCAVNPRPIPKDAGNDHPSLYLNRELGWLDFNWRVLYQAMDDRHPLLERVKFLGITCSNLDEFIQKRVGGLKRQEAAGVSQTSPDGRSPAEQIALVQQEAYSMHKQITRVWTNDLVPELEKAGLKISGYHQLSDEQRKQADKYYMAHIYPILTPLAVDPGHPFPFISNLSLSMAIILKHPDRDAKHFARVKIPSNQHRFIWVHDKNYKWHFVPIEDLIKNNVQNLFRGMEIVDAFLFRVTRNADIRREEEEADDLLSMISEELRERRFAPVVRLEVENSMSGHVLNFLKEELGLDDKDIYHVNGTMDLTAAFEIAGRDIEKLTFPKWNPVVPKRLHHEGNTADEECIFDIIQKGDLLVHHPYDSFAASVQRLIEEAASDPKTIAIKQTLYRTSENSPIVKSLMRAAESGKQVAVLVEVKARFDEANNIEWGKMLENAGVHVTYGLVGLKTHAKVALVIREEHKGPRTYCHVGTGNYHVKTAGIYTDLGLISCDPDLGYDVTNLFHYLTGYAPEQHYKKLIVAPIEMRQRFYDLIEREIEIQQNDGKGHIIAKMNALDDVGIIQKLYKASQNGVKIDLIIRGHSRLRPSLESYSKNISIISIIGRFLEHERVWYFRNKGNDDVYMGSADWRNRNLSGRVEAIVPITAPKLKQRVKRILFRALEDNRLAWDMHADGSYTQRQPKEGEKVRNFHKILMEDALERTKGH